MVAFKEAILYLVSRELSLLFLVHFDVHKLHSSVPLQKGEGYKAGHVSKEDYAKTLRAYQQTRDEMKSAQRAKVAALYPTTDQYV